MYDYYWEQVGDPHSGMFDLSVTGTSRYDLLEDFFDISNTQAEQSPGHMNLYPFGQTFVDPGHASHFSHPAWAGKSWRDIKEFEDRTAPRDAAIALTVAGGVYGLVRAAPVVYHTVRSVLTKEAAGAAGAAAANRREQIEQGLANARNGAEMWLQLQRTAIEKGDQQAAAFAGRNIRHFQELITEYKIELKRLFGQ